MKESIFLHNNIDYKIMIGENRYDNWNIIDISQPYWIWFHVADSSSSHIILQIDDIKIKDIPKQVIKRCACLCKAHSSSKSLKNTISNLSKENSNKKITGLVLDLRNNPGGLLEQSVNVSDMFLDSGKIVSVKGRNIKDQVVFNASPGVIIDKNIFIIECFYCNKSGNTLV